jgi:hypothetical protein
VRSTGDFVNATAGSIAANTWHVATAIEAAADSRTIWLDGEQGTTNTDSLVPSGIDTLDLGRLGDSSPGNYFDGQVALVLVHNRVLADSETRELHADPEVWLRLADSPVAWAASEVAAPTDGVARMIFLTGEAA